MVYVVKPPGLDVSYPDLIEFANKAMPYFMVPRYLEFIDSLPKTPSEKIEKYKLKLAAAERLSEIWDREAEGIKIDR